MLVPALHVLIIKINSKPIHYFVLFLILKHRRIHKVGLKSPRLPDIIDNVEPMAWIDSLAEDEAAL